MSGGSFWSCFWAAIVITAGWAVWLVSRHGGVYLAREFRFKAYGYSKIGWLLRMQPEKCPNCNGAGGFYYSSEGLIPIPDMETFVRVKGNAVGCLYCQETGYIWKEKELETLK